MIWLIVILVILMIGYHQVKPIIKTGGKGVSNTAPKLLTYSHDHLDGGPVENTLDFSQLELEGFRPVDGERPVHLSIGYVEPSIGTRFTTRFKRQKAVFRSLLNDGKKILTNKSGLHHLGSPFVPKTYALTDFGYTGGIWIAKDSDSYGQKDVHMVRSINDLKTARGAIRGRGIISRYIDNPLLVDSLGHRKFHLRVYLGMDSRNRIGFIHNRYKILTAGAKYDPKSTDRKVHFSGGKTTDRLYDQNLIFSREQLSEIRTGLETAFEPLFEQLAGVIAPWDESADAWEVFGADVLIDTNYHPWILEINDKIGYGTFPDGDITNAEFSKEYFEWIKECFIMPYFGLGLLPPEAGPRVEILPIDKASKAHLAELGAIGELPEIYEAVGDQRKYDLAYLHNLTKFNDGPIGDYLHFAVIYDGHAIGYIGALFKAGDKHHPGFHIRYFIGPQHAGRGHATAAIRRLCEVINARFPKKPPIIAFIAETNVGSKRAIEKTTLFEDLKPEFRYGKKMLVYRYKH